ncbi:RibD family protein [Brotaphodocola sp.]|uniref:RibD family protein n=1 Tax=Brotaphodocola sp. TaxID=3073577 RepID=UPI003D7CEAC1
MKRPYVICHMMTSVDGRIDCAMTEHLPGVQEYYDTLDELDAPTRVSGKVTAELEMALPGKFHSESETPIGKEAFSKKRNAEGYEIVVDTCGTLLWEDSAEEERPLLILMSEKASREYLAYLDERYISWIVCGSERVDLKRACEILAEEFGVERMAVVGGGHINAGFLAADLLDEVSVLIGSGIDGRGGMAAVFDGLPKERPVTPLKLSLVKPYESGAVWLRYTVKN